MAFRGSGPLQLAAGHPAQPPVTVARVVDQDFHRPVAVEVADPGVAQRRLERRVHEPDRGPVTCAQGRPLTHDDPGRQWLGRRDGGLPVDRERGRAVVHDRAVVVGPDVIPVGDLLVEVVLLRRVDIGKVDGDEAIAVLTALLVPQSHGVADLVDGLTEVRELACVGRGPLREGQAAVGPPVRHGASDGVLLRDRQPWVDLEGNDAVGPPELAERNDDRTLERLVSRLARLVRPGVEPGDVRASTSARRRSISSTVPSTMSPSKIA